MSRAARTEEGRKRSSLDIARLYDKYGESMYRYLTAKLGSASDAEDILQEVFCRIVRYSARLRFVRKPRVFVFRIARNEANRFLRAKIQNDKTIQMTVDFAGSFRSSYAGPDEPAERLVADALAQVPDQQRETVILKVFEGMTFKEIAAVCDVPISTVASRYRYGIEKMHNLLEGKL